MAVMRKYILFVNGTSCGYLDSCGKDTVFIEAIDIEGAVSEAKKLFFGVNGENPTFILTEVSTVEIVEYVDRHRIPLAGWRQELWKQELDKSEAEKEKSERELFEVLKKKYGES